MFPSRAINLHISYLPYARGAHPNFWSIIEGSPCGVTIHEIDPGLDTGPILLQEPIEFDLFSESFHSTYNKLQFLIEELFSCNWHLLRASSVPSTPQSPSIGSYHTSSEIIRFQPFLPDGWNTNIAHFKELTFNASL